MKNILFLLFGFVLALPTFGQTQFSTPNQLLDQPLSKETTTITGKAKTPAVAYITQAGIQYYKLKNVKAGPVPTGLNITWGGNEMTYTSTQGVTGIFQKIGQTTFLNGTVLFFKFKDNPDPGYSPQPVNRIAAIGVKKDGSFGFLREIDFLNSPFPSTKSFETFITSTGKNTFVVLEAGSPSALK